MPTFREVEAGAYGHLWLHCEFKVSLGYNEISKNGGGWYRNYNSHIHQGFSWCYTMLDFLLPPVSLGGKKKRVLYQLLSGNGLHSEQRNQAPYVGGTERESLRLSSSSRRKEAAAASASKWLHTCQDSWATSFVLGGTGAYQKAWTGTGEASN